MKRPHRLTFQIHSGKKTSSHAPESNTQYQAYWSSSEELDSLLYYSSNEYTKGFITLFEKGIVKDKKVLVIQCGFGTLAKLAHDHGAKKVVAIDDRPVYILFKNFVEESKIQNIEVYNIKISEIHEHFDVIICNWMGINLVCFSLLQELYTGRSLLSDGGVIIPSKGNCYIQGFCKDTFISKQKKFWQDVYGYDMSPLMDKVVGTVYIDNTGHRRTCTNTYKILCIDTATFQPSTTYTSDFKLKMLHEDTLVGFFTFFEVFGNKKMLITTEDGDNRMWKHCCLFLPEPVKLREHDTIKGTIRFITIDDEWKVSVEYTINGSIKGTIEYSF